MKLGFILLLLIFSFKDNLYCHEEAQSEEKSAGLRQNIASPLITAELGAAIVVLVGITGVSLLLTKFASLDQEAKKGTLVAAISAGTLAGIILLMPLLIRIKRSFS